MTDAIDVVELALRHGVVDVDGREQERTRFHHLVEPVHAGGCLLADTADAATHGRPAARIRLQLARDRLEDDAPFLRVLVRIEGRDLLRCLELRRLVHKERGVATVIDDE